MSRFLNSLLSRKFLLALGAAAVFLANREYDKVFGVVLAYLGVEGAADYRSR